jgi:hypothetical protein
MLTLLKLGDLFLVVEKYTYTPDGADFLFHSHQCPSNILHNVLAVVDPEHGSDPHGRIRFVSGIEDTPEARAALGFDDRGGVGHVTLAQTLGLFGTDGQPTPSSWPERDNGVIPWLADLQREHRLKTKA